MPDDRIDRPQGIIAQRFEERERMAVALFRAELTGVGLRQALGEELRPEAVAARGAHRAMPVPGAEVHDHKDPRQERFIQPERRAARHIRLTIGTEHPENRTERRPGPADRGRGE